MKNKYLKILATVFFIVYISFYFNSCDTLLEFPQPSEDINIGENQSTKIPISIQFLNATTNPRSVQPSNVSVEIYDEGGNLVSSVNTEIPKQEPFLLNENILNLQVSNAVLSPESGGRYAFTIYANAPNFSSVTKTIVVTNRHGIYVPIYMIHKPKIELSPNKPQIKKLADGLIENRINTPYNTAILKNPLEISNIQNTEPPSINSLNTEIFFEGGTQFQDNGGNSVEGNLASIELYTGDTRFDIPLRTFPNNFLVTNAIIGESSEKVATLTKPFFFRVFSYVDLNITLNNKKIEKLSKPAAFRINLNSVKNKTFDFKESDSIEIWTLDKNTGQWKLESIAKIAEGDNGQEVTFKAREVSTYVLAKRIAACPTPVQILIDNGSAPYRVRFFELKYGPSSGSTGTVPTPHFLVLQPGIPYDVNFIAPIDSLYLNIKESANPTHPTFVKEGFSLKTGCVSKLGKVLVPPQTGKKCEQVQFELKKHPTGTLCSIKTDISVGVYTKVTLPYGTLAGFLNNGLLNLDMAGMTSGNSMNLRMDYNSQFISLDLTVNPYHSGSPRFDPTTNNIGVESRSPDPSVIISGASSSSGSICGNKTRIDFRIAQSLYTDLCNN